MKLLWNRIGESDTFWMEVPAGILVSYIGSMVFIRCDRVERDRWLAKMEKKK